MSGDRPPIQLDAPAGSVLARAIDALGRFPDEPAWVLVGGIAVFIRLGSVTRPTADADTVARSQAELLNRLVNDEVATIVSGGEARDTDRRQHHRGRRHGPRRRPAPRRRRASRLRTRPAIRPRHRREGTHRRVRRRRRGHRGDYPGCDGRRTGSAQDRVDGPPAAGNSPHKVGSDIHDLVRLVAGAGGRNLAADIAADAELGHWVADQVGRSFGTDLRYPLLRLRTNDRSPGAQALTDAQVEATVVLADALAEELERQ